jgi:hypothetical protein
MMSVVLPIKKAGSEVGCSFMPQRLLDASLVGRRCESLFRRARSDSVSSQIPAVDRLSESTRRWLFDCVEHPVYGTIRRYPTAQVSKRAIE